MKDENELKARLGPNPYDELFALAALLPAPWRGMRPDAVFESLRCRLNFTQDEVGIKGGMTQNQVSRIEGGFDARMSTWKKAFSAMGFDIFLLPMPRGPMRRLEALAERCRPANHFLRQRARPRRRYKAEMARRRAERKAAKERVRRAAEKRQRWLERLRKEEAPGA